jgi:glycogen operon protein
MLLIHAGTLPREFALPPMPRSVAWRLFINTAAESPFDAYPNLDGPAPPAGGKLVIPAKTVVCYVSTPVAAPVRARAGGEV